MKIGDRVIVQSDDATDLDGKHGVIELLISRSFEWYVSLDKGDRVVFMESELTPEPPATDQPATGDKVRVSIESTVGPNGGYVGSRYIKGTYANYDATLEILTRADDPANDDIGTVRQWGTDDSPKVKSNGFGHANWVDLSPKADAFKFFTNEEMAGSHIIGTVPGTPATQPTAPEWDYYKEHHRDGYHLFRFPHGASGSDKGGQVKWFAQTDDDWHTLHLSVDDLTEAQRNG